METFILFMVTFVLMFLLTDHAIHLQMLIYAKKENTTIHLYLQ